MQTGVHPAEDDQLRVEQVDQVADAEPQPTTDGVDGREYLRVTGVGEGDDVIDRRPASSAG